LLIVEIKSEIVDLQDLLRALDIKARVIPGEVRRSHGWQAECMAVVVLLPNNNAHRRAAASHAAILAAALPARTREVRRWIAQPAGSLRGIWFFPCISGRSTGERTSAGRRVSAPRGTPAPTPPMPLTHSRPKTGPLERLRTIDLAVPNPDDSPGHANSNFRRVSPGREFLNTLWVDIGNRGARRASAGRGGQAPGAAGKRRARRASAGSDDQSGPESPAAPPGAFGAWRATRL
jgi:hypothetical protein